MDNGLVSFSKVLKDVFGVDSQVVKGAGAAAGMGIASLVFLNGHLLPGIELIKNLAQFDSHIKDASWIISGEGKLDSQTFSGKTIQGVIHSAKEKNIKLAVFCGTIDLKESAIEDLNISYAASIMEQAKDLNDALTNADLYLKKLTVEFARNTKLQ